MIHAYASRAHYFEHLEPIWDALPDDLRGEVFSPAAMNAWGSARPRPVTSADAVLVASFADSRKMARARVVYVEHGAGQTYDGDERARAHGSYAGGDGHGHTILFLCPREEIAQRWRAAYPSISAVAVGCPKLDRYARNTHVGDQTVAFSFHWDNPLCSESRSALPHYRRALRGIIEQFRDLGWRVLGHGHPREMNHLCRMWRDLDVPIVTDQRYVMSHASVFVADNTSALYEAAAVGIPVVCLNAPWYRREIEHGLRFWDAVPGRQVDDPDALVPAVERAVLRLPHDETERARAVAKAYASVDGQATDRAVAAILEVI